MRILERYNFTHSPNTAHHYRLTNFQVITNYVYGLLEERGMHKVPIPLNEDAERATFIFSTKPELERPEKLLVLIHGSGVVRAGQWARSLIINHSIGAGTQIPYIEEGRKRSFDVILTNTNDNHRNHGLLLRLRASIE